MECSRPKLFVLTGPTAVGKTELSLQMAEFLHCPIISADSRQMFADLPIGTAAPTAEQLARVQHYFVGNLALTDYYSAARFEEEALKVCEHHFADHDTLVVSGGSMMYVDALCRGIDPLPTISEEVRTTLYARLESEGLSALLQELEERDPAYIARVDVQNAKRVVHALEIIYESGQRVSELLTGEAKKRPFDVVKIGLPEFETPEAVKYFTDKKEKSIGSFAANLEKTGQYVQRLNGDLAELETLMAEGGAGLNGEIGMEDILVFPILRNLTVVRGVEWPQKVMDYLLRMSEASGVPLYFDHAL